MTAISDVFETWHGDPALRVRGDGLTAVVLPDRGGRIASLIDASGQEWLEQPALPLTPVAALPPGFVDGDMFGWDECAPTVDACTVDGRELPDHGELWDIGWRVDADGWLQADAPSGTFRLRRRLTPAPGGLLIEYEAGTDLDAVPFLWAAHPQFRAPAGTRVAIAARVDALVDGEDETLPRIPLHPGLTSIDNVPRGGAGKLFVEPDVRVGQASLVWANGTSLTLSWDPELVPYLGIWFDRGRHSRHDVIAVEPMTGFFDWCDRALARGRVHTLTAGVPFRWSLRLVAGGAGEGRP